jgi:thiosulfate/3-mercaptopyruvate sulfurtransferase
MNKTGIVLTLSIACIFAVPISRARSIDPIVSTDWLAQNLEDSGIVILDIRSSAQYKRGHIPHAVNAPMSAWTVAANGLNYEVPSEPELKNLLGKLGIPDGTSRSVVVVNGTMTCILAGVKKVSVLDGGYTKWVKENREKSTDIVNPQPVTYSGKPDRSSLVSKSYVLNKIGKSIILDARDPADYFGITSKPGHIKSAVDLPAPWAFTPDGTFRDKAELQAMAIGVLGRDSAKEILAYCGVGGYASTWWFLLSEVFGYKNVKLYDGSMEEWLKDPNDPVSTYIWN